MRKLLSLCTIMVLVLMVGCATLQKPDKIVILNLAAQNCGFLLAQENPALAKDILKYSKGVLDKDFTKPAFIDWSEWVAKAVKLDPFLEMNFKEMMKLVTIEIELTEDQRKIVMIYRQIVQYFVKGIEARGK